MSLPGKIKQISDRIAARPIFWTVLAFFLSITARVIPGPRTIDDAYITFRYARNFLLGHGLVYNIGENVLGTTTALYAGLLAFLGFFAGGSEADFPGIALALNAVADGFTAILLVYIGVRAGYLITGIAAAFVWAILPFSVTFAIGGLETSLYILLLTGTIAAYISSRPVLTALLAAASFLTRPDALILLGPLALDRLIRAPNVPGPWKSKLLTKTKPISWKEIMAAGAPVGLWIGYSWTIYGSPLPHSMAAKSAAYQLPETQALIRLLQHYTTPFMENLTLGVPAIAIGLILYPFLSLVAVRKLSTTTPLLIPWLLFPWLYFITYAIANPLIFRWYLTPPLAPYIFSIFIGANVLIDSLAMAVKPDKWRLILRQTASIILIICPLLFISRGWTLHPNHGLEQPAPEMAWHALELKYEEAAKWLYPEMSEQKPSPVMAAGDVGVLGFITGVKILDTVGLISPEAVPYYPTNPEYYVTAYAVSPELILDYMPDYVVLLEVYGRGGLFKNPEFQAQYILHNIIPTDIYGSEGLLIYKKAP